MDNTLSLNYNFFSQEKDRKTSALLSHIVKVHAKGFKEVLNGFDRLEKTTGDRLAEYQAHLGAEIIHPTKQNEQLIAR